MTKSQKEAYLKMSYQNMDYEHTKDFFGRLNDLLKEGESKLLLAPKIVSTSTVKDDNKKWYVLVQGNSLQFILPKDSDPYGFRKDFIYSRAKNYFTRCKIMEPVETKEPYLDFLTEQTKTVIKITA